MDEQQLYSGQGTVFCAPIVNGVRGELMEFGDVPTATMTPSSNKVEHKETKSGMRAVNSTLNTELKMAWAFTVDDHRPAVLGIAFRSDLVKTPESTVTDEVMREGLKTGEFVALAKTNISDLEIEDNAGVALVEGVDYRISGAAYGSLQILDGSKFTLAAKASYTAGPSTGISLMSKKARRYYFRIEGLNTVDGGLPVLLEFETILDPAKVLNLFSDGFGSIEMTGDVLFVNGEFGKFRVIG